MFGNFSFKRESTFDGWPVDEAGNKIAPAFLQHVAGGKVEIDMTVALLRSYNIPVICEYPNDGEFAKIIMGYAPTGTDIYVPETMLEDAMNIISCDMSEAEEEFAEVE